jgi:DNA-binding NarL/FixJ family response regulator
MKSGPQQMRECFMAGEQILVVEDQRAVAGALRMRLRGLGYDVTAIAKDAVEAIEKASELQPDLILMDIRLGEGMDGIEAAHRIRSHHDIPVIYISAHVDLKLLERARATQPAGFITKPFTTKDLMTAIDLALHRQGKDTPSANEAPARYPESPGRELHAVISTDVNGRVNFVDAIAERNSGWTRRQLLGRPMADIIADIYEASPAEAATLVRRVLQEGGDVPLTRPASAGAPEARRHHDTLTALHDTRGQVLGLALHFDTSPAAGTKTSPTRGREQALATALDAVPVGVLLLSPTLQVLHANQCAREIIARNRGLELRNETLVAVDKHLNEKLKTLVRSAAEKARHGASAETGAMFIKAPMAREQMEVVVSGFCSDADEEPCIITYVFDTSGQRRTSYEVLTKLYGLTQAEAKLVQLLVNGMTLDEAAQELQISVNTARTHLKHVFHKTGINRQTELIHCIETGAAALLLRFDSDQRIDTKLLK